jgi:CMP/dCMP kinase
VKKARIIAIDGPAGSGKSTIAKMLAKKLGCLYIDTGAMYRALTLKALNIKADLEDQKFLVKLAKETSITLKNKEDGSLKVYLDGEDVTLEIRDPEVANKVAYIANIPALRSIMVKKQRVLRKLGPLVIEGRDIATVVFPKADKKFYLDASFDERLNRRHKQLKEEGRKIAEGKLRENIRTRDKKDKERKVGGLKIAKSAIYIDTTNLSRPEVIDKLLSYIR